MLTPDENELRGIDDAETKPSEQGGTVGLSL